MPRRRTVVDLPDHVVYDVARRFLDGQTATPIKEAITKAYPNDARVDAFTREQVYPTVREAVNRGFLQFVPPLTKRLAELIGKFPNQGEVRVVGSAESVYTTDEVAVVSAYRLVELIKEIEASREPGPVHIGMGIGRTNERLAMALGSILRSRPDLPDLVIHALNTDHATWNPSENPIAYFTYLKDSLNDVSFVGLQATLFLDAGGFASEPLYLDAIEQRDEIDIIVSSIAARKDEHGFLRRYMEKYSWMEELADLETTDWVGDMMLRPFDAVQPVHVNGRQPVALFELEDLVEFARQPHKHVLLMCAACGQCGERKLSALEPLLCEPLLHTWDNLVLDLDTARELVKLISRP
jgi:DNA-binding transcriptional regulator LsrR (DeoR family)